MKNCLGFLFFCFISAIATGQRVKLTGVVTDTAGSTLANASIKIKSGKDSIPAFSNNSGLFFVAGLPSASFSLEISMVGFASFKKEYGPANAPDATINIGKVSLVPIASELDEVVITAVTPVKIMEDTVQYSVAAYKVREGAPAEDVIKKLPGLSVDKDGKITSQGKAVSRIRVNGKDFFGGDVQTATQNLPAEILDNIQVIEDYGDQANLTGIKTGDPEVIININIKNDKSNGRFGRVNLGAGTKERYVAGGMLNVFKEERQISLLTSLNNTNTNTFDFNGGGRGGGARGSNFGSSERGGGGGNGLTNAKSAGLNYRDKWGEKISVYGSYSFSERSTETTNSSQGQDINPANIRYTSSIRNSFSQSRNHRATFNLDYRIDTSHFIKITPYFSSAYSANNSIGISEISRKQYFTGNNSNNSNKSNAPNAGTGFMYNHKFSKKGRNLNINGNVDFADRSQGNNTLNNYRNIDSAYLPPAISDTIQQQLSDIASRNTRTNVRISYAEPLGKSKVHFVEASYEWNRSATTNARNVLDMDPSSKVTTFNNSQSNHFNYQFITNRIGLNLKGNNKKYNYVAGVMTQPSILKGQSVGKNVNTRYTNINWIPTARFNYDLGKSHRLTASYDGRSREPNFMQLQPVSDSTNLNNIVTGNPNLQAEFNNNYSIRYHKFDKISGRTIFSNFNYDKTSNKIVTSRVNNPTGTGRTTTYLNTDGFYRVSGNGHFSQGFSNRKYTATIDFAASYDNNISYTDNQRNKGRNWNLRPGAAFRLDLQDIIDVTLNAGYTFYKTTTQYATYTNTSQAKTLNYGISGKNYFLKDLTLGYEVAKMVNYGFGSINSNPLIINVYAEYRFLKGKKATIKLQGFDLLNENTGITRNISETTITDSQSNRLARYGLLSFNLRLQKFGGGLKKPERYGRDRDNWQPEIN